MLHTSKLLYLTLSLLATTAPDPEMATMHADVGRNQVWNQFTNDVYALHLQQLQGREVGEVRTVGGYPDDKEYYIQVEFYDKQSNLLLSRIRWEKSHPDVIHVIEVFVHDKQGRVIRDYTSAYLPHYRNAPIQTLIALHGYNRELHAFRSFDASGEEVNEICRGSYEGQRVYIDLETDELEKAKVQPNPIMASAMYHRCFDHVEKDVTPYLHAEQGTG